MGGESRVAELEQQLATLQEDFDDYQATSTEVQQELESEVDELSKELAAARERAAELESAPRKGSGPAASTSAADTEALMAQVRARDEQVSALKDRVRELENQNEDLEKQARAWELSASDAQGQVDDALERVALAESDLEESRQRHQEQRLEEQLREGGAGQTPAEAESTGEDDAVVEEEAEVVSHPGSEAASSEDEWEGQVRELEETNAALSSEMEEMSEDLMAKSKEIEELSSQLSAARKEVDDMKQDIQHFEFATASQDEEKAALEVSLRDAEREREEAREEATALRAEAAEVKQHMQEEVERAKQSVASLQSEVNIAASASQDKTSALGAKLAAERQRASTAESSLQEARKEKKEVEKGLEEALARAEQAEEALEKAKKTAAEEKEELEKEVQEANKTAATEKEELQEQVEEARKAAAEAKEELEKKMEEASTRAEKAEAALEEARKTVKELEKEREEAKKDADKEKEELQEQVEEVSARADKAEAALEEARRSSVEGTSAETALEEARKAAAEAKESLMKQVEEASTRAEKAEAALEEARKAAEKEQETLREKLAVATARTEELSSRQGADEASGAEERRALEARVRKAESRAEEAEEARAREVGDLRSAVAEEEARAEEALAALVKARDTSQQSASRIAQLEGDLDDARAALADAEQRRADDASSSDRVAALEKEVAEAQAAVEEAQAALRAKDDELTSTSRQLREARKLVAGDIGVEALEEAQASAPLFLHGGRGEGAAPGGDETGSAPADAAAFSGAEQLGRDVQLAVKELLSHVRASGDEATRSAAQSLARWVRALWEAHVEEMRANADLLRRAQASRPGFLVMARVRPRTKEEVDAGRRVAAEAADPTTLVVRSPSGHELKPFAVDCALGPQARQRDLYAELAPLAHSVLHGDSACVFAYGQTGSGKTFSMLGERGQEGLSPRILSRIFQLAALRGHTHEHRVYASMVEIYNEELRDLLAPPRSQEDAKAPRLDIQAASGRVTVPGLTRARVRGTADIGRLFARGQRHRATAATAVHEHSSRSHSVLMVELWTRERAREAQRDAAPDPTGVAQWDAVSHDDGAAGGGVEGADELVLETVGRGGDVEGEGGEDGDARGWGRARLYLVDLAGSERVGRSEVRGQRLREARNINRSLSALGDVMEALERRSKHIPYRNSKLTYFLQDALNGASKTVMLVAVTPTAECRDETMCSLQFAQRVRRIDLRSAKRAAQLKAMESHVERLKQELHRAHADTGRAQEQLDATRRQRDAERQQHGRSISTQRRVDHHARNTLTQDLRDTRRANESLQEQLQEAKVALARATDENQGHTQQLRKALRERELAVKERDEAIAAGSTRDAEIRRLRAAVRQLQHRIGEGRRVHGPSAANTGGEPSSARRPPAASRTAPAPHRDPVARNRRSAAPSTPPRRAAGDGQDVSQRTGVGATPSASMARTGGLTAPTYTEMVRAACDSAATAPAPWKGGEDGAAASGEGEERSSEVAAVPEQEAADPAGGGGTGAPEPQPGPDAPEEGRSPSTGGKEAAWTGEGSGEDDDKATPMDRTASAPVLSLPPRGRDPGAPEPLRSARSSAGDSAGAKGGAEEDGPGAGAARAPRGVSRQAAMAARLAAGGSSHTRQAGRRGGPRRTTTHSHISVRRGGADTGAAAAPRRVTRSMARRKQQGAAE